MRKLLARTLVVLHAATLIVSTTVVFIPAARTPTAHFAVLLLVALVSGEAFWSMRRSGILRMTPAQVFASYDPHKPRATLLGAVAALMGAVAIVILSLR